MFSVLRATIKTWEWPGDEATKITHCTCVHGSYIKPYLREDVHTHKEENIEEKENQNGPCYVDSNVKTDDKYDPAEKK